MSRCISCGRELSTRLGGLCAACLLRSALEADVAPGLKSPKARVIAPIGRGPHATVYLAQGPKGHQDLMTLKVFEEQLDSSTFIAHIEALIRKLRTFPAAASVTIVEGGQTENGTVWVLARYVPGASIDAFCRLSGSGNFDRRTLVARLCLLVSEMHRVDIVHGSIKPSNVIVTAGSDGPEVVLLDTGLQLALETARSIADAGTQERDDVPNRRRDLLALHALVVDLLGGGDLGAAPESIRALARRRYASASELAEDITLIAGTK